MNSLVSFSWKTSSKCESVGGVPECPDKAKAEEICDKIKGDAFKGEHK